MSSSDDPTPGVTISASTLRSVGTYPACFLTFTPAGSFEPDALIPRVHRAITAVNADTPGEPLVTVAAVVEGHDALHVRLHYGDAERREVRSWVTQLAGALTEVGLAGTLGQQPPYYPPEWALFGSLHNRAVSVLYATREAVNGSVTRQLAIAHDVALLPHHALSGGSKFSFAVPLTPRLLAEMPATSARTLMSWDHEPARQTSLTIGSFSCVGWTNVGDRTEQSVRARAALVALAPALDQGFAEVMTGTDGWGRAPHRASDGVTATEFVQRRDLWPHRVIDPHGLQILTAHHLARASSLAAWRTRQLGDRYLVEARDLEPWLAKDNPDTEVLESARADFGAMIITQPELDALRAAEREARLRRYQEGLARGEDT